MRTATAILDEIKKANMWDINLDDSVNKATSCWWAVGEKKVFLNWQTVPELLLLQLNHLLWRFLHLPLKLQVLRTQTECKNRQTSFFHFHISSVKKEYHYTIQLSMVIASSQNLKRRIELLISKFPLTIINSKVKALLEESFGSYRKLCTSFSKAYLAFYTTS